MKQIKVGMIGAGAIAELHLAGIQRHPQAQVVAIADPSQTRREQLAHRFHVPNTFDNALKMLEETDVDAVSIAVPNALHLPLAVAALESGRHVLLEKPFARNLEEACQINNTAQRCGRLLMVGMNQRFAPETQAVKRAIDEGRLGRIYHAKAYWMRRSGIPRFGTWFSQRETSGGGALLDIGVHMLDLCLYLLDNYQVRSVTAGSYSELGPRGLGEGDWGLSDPVVHPFDVDDFTSAFIRLEDDSTVALDASWALNQQDLDRRDVQLFGTGGGARVYPVPCIFSRMDSRGTYQTVEPAMVDVRQAPCRFTHWIDAILGRAELICTVPQALKVQAIIDAAYRSAKTGREVLITSPELEHV